MRTKNARAISRQESEHMAAVKRLPCSVCSTPGPSDAHHIVQGQHFTVVALCKDCHQGGFNGWHGHKRMWAVMKMDELAALNVTIRRLMENTGKPAAGPTLASPRRTSNGNRQGPDEEHQAQAGQEADAGRREARKARRQEARLLTASWAR